MTQLTPIRSRPRNSILDPFKRRKSGSVQAFHQAISTDFAEADIQWSMRTRSYTLH